MAINLATALGSVTLLESVEDYTKGIDENGPFVTKTYELTDWTKVDAVLTALKGGVRLSGGLGGTIARTAPHQCPENPSLFCVQAKMVDGSPLDAKDGSRPQFNKAIIQCTYGVLPFSTNPLDDPGGVLGFPSGGDPYTYAVMEVESDQEAIILPNTAYTFASDGKKSQARHVKYVGRGNLIFTRKQMPYLYLSLYFSLLNKVNNATFLGQATGKVRFANFSTRTEFQSDGTRAHEVRLVFKWREQEWNKFHRDDNSTFDTLQDGSSNKPYSSADLSPLLA